MTLEWDGGSGNQCQVYSYWPAWPNRRKRYTAHCRRCDWHSIQTWHVDQAVEYAMRHNRTRQHSPQVKFGSMPDPLEVVLWDLMKLIERVNEWSADLVARHPEALPALASLALVRSYTG